MLGPIGPTEIAVMGGLLILLFGAKRLPELARSFGQGLREFKRSLKDTDGEEQAAERKSGSSNSAPPPSGD